MSISVHNRIRVLIEETSDAFSCCGSVNADYAEFATLALSDFKNVLMNQKLTSSQLKRMLRKGMNKHKNKAPDSWSAFMARHVARTANRNSGSSASI